MHASIPIEFWNFLEKTRSSTAVETAIAANPERNASFFNAVCRSPQIVAKWISQTSFLGSNSVVGALLSDCDRRTTHHCIHWASSAAATTSRSPSHEQFSASGDRIGISVQAHHLTASEPPRNCCFIAVSLLAASLLQSTIQKRSRERTTHTLNKNSFWTHSYATSSVADQ